MSDDSAPSKAFTAARDGFSLNAGVACEAHERAKLERLWRYVCRPAIAEQRLSIDGDRLIVYELKRPFSDGTTHVLFEPHDFIARLAAIVPRPRGHLVRYHALFAPNARHRQAIVPRQRHQPTAEHAEPRASMNWMARLKRVFDIDLSQCPNSGARLRVIGEVTAPNVIARILAHVQARGPGDHGARAPPVLSVS